MRRQSKILENGGSLGCLDLEVSGSITQHKHCSVLSGKIKIIKNDLLFPITYHLNRLCNKTVANQLCIRRLAQELNSLHSDTVLFHAVENNCGYHLFESDSEEEEEEVIEKKDEVPPPPQKKTAFQVRARKKNTKLTTKEKDTFI